MNIEQFAKDVESGLSSKVKSLPSRYFYDENGDRIFQQIMEMPEYYLTDAEFEIFNTRKQEIMELFDPGGEFDLVELGAGDGQKTRVLLKYFVNKGERFKYMPVDISQNVLDILTDSLEAEMPDLVTEPLHGEYFTCLRDLNLRDHSKKVVLFLGGNIGNFTLERSEAFLRKLHQNLDRGDMVMIGIDLKKDPDKILSAYSDPHGITRSFNLNLLTRINRELGGNFVEHKFRHYATYDPVNGEARSYLLSMGNQDVDITALNKTFHFDWYEPIFMEISRKYDVNEIEQLAQKNGYKVRKHLYDCKQQFVDTIWEVE